MIYNEKIHIIFDIENWLWKTEFEIQFSLQHYNCSNTKSSWLIGLSLSSLTDTYHQTTWRFVGGPTMHSTSASANKEKKSTYTYLQFSN